DSALADAACLGDLARRAPLGDEPRDLAFALAQPPKGVFGGLPGGAWLLLGQGGQRCLDEAVARLGLIEGGRKNRDHLPRSRKCLVSERLLLCGGVGASE